MDWLEILKVNKGLSLFFDVSIPAAIARNNVFGHILLVCPDFEVRKQFITTLVSVIRATEDNQTDVDENNTNGYKMANWNRETTPGELSATLTNLFPGDMLVLNRDEFEIAQECTELVSSALDSFNISIVIGRGPSANTVLLDLPQFTMVTCVDHENDELRMMENHFAYIIRIGKEELSEICEKAVFLKALEEGCSLTDEACHFIVSSASSDCLTAMNYVTRVVEYMRYYHSIGTQITEEHANMVLGSMGLSPKRSSDVPIDDVSQLLRDIQRKISQLSSEISGIKKVLLEIQGDGSGHSLSEISETLDRIEESLY